MNALKFPQDMCMNARAFHDLWQHFSCHLSHYNVELQVEMVCCAYYHLLAQQVFMLEKSKIDVYFLQHKNLLRKEVSVVIRSTNQLNLQRNIVARQVRRITGLYGHE